MTDVDVPLPEGITLETSGETVTLVNRHRDLGDIFALTFLGLIVIGAAAAAGDKLYGANGTLGGLLITSPAWGYLWLASLRRLLNTRRVVAKPGSLALVIGPVPGGGGVSFESKDIGAIHTKAFENISSTRGATKPLVTKTYSVWVRTTSGDEIMLVEPLDTDAQARHVEKALTHASKAR